MIGADANVLLRLFLRDEPGQLAAVEARLERAIEAREDIYVGPLALAETVWVLARRRRATRADIAAAVRVLASARPFRLFDAEVVESALDRFESSRAGFTDCLISAMNAAAGCRATLTFDRAALRVPGFAHPAEA